MGRVSVYDFILRIHLLECQSTGRGDQFPVYNFIIHRHFLVGKSAHFWAIEPPGGKTLEIVAFAGLIQ